ncbi:uncharacterized protein LOC125215048 isoform X5 [Salvia hispanica]|uniref:uncharacterized protein LOC125215048 isoform X5 n=1 Tax=Salvia hispanica TaxID=49212 RepID=UPI00200904EC|nr:uncharacterized protein LOC125215048 isoform X5 [Salvia hispanica]
MATFALHAPNFSRRWTIVSCATKGQQCLQQTKKSSPSNIIFETPREARHDEEYWEFNAMTRRYNANMGKKCLCIIVMVKNENGEVKPSIPKSVAGSLDLSIQHLSHGETFPGEWLKHPLLCLLDTKPSIRYGYIANLCIAKYARRQGVASVIIDYAISVAKSNGAEKVFVHVHRHNKPARNLYQKIGFQVVDAASTQLSAEQTFLLCLELSSSDVSNGR